MKRFCKTRQRNLILLPPKGHTTAEKSAREEEVRRHEGKHSLRHCASSFADRGKVSRRLAGFSGAAGLPPAAISIFVPNEAPPLPPLSVFSPAEIISVFETLQSAVGKLDGVFWNRDALLPSQNNKTRLTVTSLRNYFHVIR